MSGNAAFYFDFAAGDRGRDHECSGLDAVGNDRMLGTAEGLDAVDLDGRSSGTS